MQQSPFDSSDQKTYQGSDSSPHMYGQYIDEDYSTQFMEPPPKRRTLWQRLYSTKTNTRLLLFCGLFSAVLLLCLGSYLFYIGTASPSNEPSNTGTSVVYAITPQPSYAPTKSNTIPTNIPTQTTNSVGVTSVNPSQSPTATATNVLSTPTTTSSTPNPTTAPSPVATNNPTLDPTPSPVVEGLNGNPWGYDLTPPGYLIYHPPAHFCDYFKCQRTFWQQANGYVAECVDGTYTHQGGKYGVCLLHGGEKQPLYRHS